MTQRAVGYGRALTRPATVIAAAVLGTVLGAFFAFTCFAILSLSTSAAFTFDLAGAIGGAAGMALGALIVVAAIALLWGRLRLVLILSCAVAMPAIGWGIAVGALGGLFTFMGLVALVFAAAIIILTARPAVRRWASTEQTSTTGDQLSSAGCGPAA